MTQRRPLREFAEGLFAWPVAVLGALALSACVPTGTTQAPDEMHSNEHPANRVAIAIHGGAGSVTPAGLSSEQEAAYEAALQAALEAGHRILVDGGSAVDAVVAAIVRMEDDPLFNAGRGAVFTAEGRNELDSSIMEGRNREAGAVAGVTRIKNPIRLARAVMEHSEHVMFAREGAEAFAEQHGLEFVPEEYFFTERRYEALQRAQERGRTEIDHDDVEARVMGTVGAVALDRNGDLAAGTSTGGMTNKRFGRVGDSPVIGAGTYADNRSCAVSSTGHGEYFIRNVVAYDICARMMYRGQSVEEAADAVIHGTLLEHGGTGGVIVIDRAGNIAMPFNTAGMFRGSVSVDGRFSVEIYADDR